MTTNFYLKLQNSKKLVIGGVIDIYMKNLGCSSTSDVVGLEFIFVQMHFDVVIFLEVPCIKIAKTILHCYKPNNSQSKDFCKFKCRISKLT